MKRTLPFIFTTVSILLLRIPSQAGEGPFMVTYTHQLEEPGNLEFATKSITAASGNRFWGAAAEFEYGVKGWWTTEVYLDGQSTQHDSTIFTGYRWENRFRVLQHEHWINPVLYIEFENINGADKTLLEVVGNDGKSDLTDTNDEARREKQREIEAKLILSSYFRGWTIAENFIAEKNVAHEPFEFGYAAGVSRPLSLVARPDACQLCRENFDVGVEFYGGLGTNRHVGFRDTSHYVAPTLSWTANNGTTLRVSAGAGLTGNSVGFLLRVGASYEIAQLGRRAPNMLRHLGTWK